MSVDKSAPHRFEPGPFGLAVLFFAARLVTLIGTPQDALAGFGDFWNFFHLAEIEGLPFIHYWVEFPPVFPFLSEALYLAAHQQEHVYNYLLSFILALANAGGVYFFARIDERLNLQEHRVRSYWMALILLALPYSHTYFDPLAVFFMMSSLWLILCEKNTAAGFLAALGGLTKLFPLLAVAALWGKNWRHWVKFFAPVLLLFGVVYGGLYLSSPDFTWASMTSQGSKGSWETVWALIDNNYRSGNFGPLWERLDPATAARPMGNLAKIPSLITLVVFGAAGFFALLRTHIEEGRQRIAAVGLAACIFFLWSPGWSVQWVLFLIPLILLVLPGRLALLLVFGHVLVNLMEWPVFLARQQLEMLNLTVGLRTVLLLIAGLAFFEALRKKAD